MSYENRNEEIHSRIFLDKVKEWDATVETLRKEIWLFLSNKDTFQESLTVDDISIFILCEYY